MKRRLTALLLVLLCLPLTACQKQQKLYSATWFDLFDTVAIVQGYADSQDSWNAQTQAMYSDLQRYNELFDIYHHYDGVINLYDVNARAAAAPVQVSDELYAFLRWCKDAAYPAANGATNIAAGAVLRLWHDARESDFQRNAKKEASSPQQHYIRPSPDRRRPAPCSRLRGWARRAATPRAARRSRCGSVCPQPWWLRSPRPRPSAAP